MRLTCGYDPIMEGYNTSKSNAYRDLGQFWRVNIAKFRPFIGALIEDQVTIVRNLTERRFEMLATLVTGLRTDIRQVFNCYYLTQF
jgi:hypothetical protein